MRALSLQPPVSDQPWKKADRIGVIMSILCAVHCAVTPFLLLLLPTFGKIWSHPASHWGIALFVVPVAVIMMTSGYRRHRRKWIIAMGILGIALVITGAIIPYLKNSNEAPATNTPAESEPFVWKAGDPLPPAETDSEPFVYKAGDPLPEDCADICCPTLITTADGSLKLYFPLASIVTTLGGLALIATHLGNLCCCASCSKKKDDIVP